MFSFLVLGFLALIIGLLSELNLIKLSFSKGSVFNFKQAYLKKNLKKKNEFSGI